MINEKTGQVKRASNLTTQKTPPKDAPKGLRRRGFELIRLPERAGDSFLFNNVQVRYVATCPETGISFYINTGYGGVIGVRVYPNGRKVLENPNKIDWAKKHGKTEYLKFMNAFGNCKGILVSHAVYIAWRNKEIPAGMTIDHIDGCSTNNYFPNLRCVSNEINNRDGGFLRKLRNKGLSAVNVQRPYLLRYFDRMATLKSLVSQRRYDNLTKGDLEVLLYFTAQAAALHLYKTYDIQINFKLSAEENRREMYLRVLRETDHDPRIFTPAQLEALFAIPFPEFKSKMSHLKNQD